MCPRYQMHGIGGIFCYAASSIKKACRIISTEEMVAGAKRCYNIGRSKERGILMQQTRLPLPVGTTDFKRICRENYYVDKTLLIKDLLDEKVSHILFTRPRRFGKTLNMDMLRTFFEKTDADTSSYFKDKAIWQQGESYRQQQGQYPVIFLSLKDIKAQDWETAYELLKMIISSEYARHPELQAGNEISQQDKDFYEKIVNKNANKADYMLSLQILSRMLYQYYKKAPVIIIDEYDTPIQEGFVNNYYNEAIRFIRNFFSAALKDNPYITMSLMTGILRVAKESIFSGLNNIRVDSVLDDTFSGYFGFTEGEVKTITQYYNVTEKLAEIKSWYDGYKFGSTEIYNPWSVINYISSSCKAIPYWSQTSENTIIHEILKKYNEATYRNLHELLKENGQVSSVIKTNIIYPELKGPQTDILGFLLMTGYLKATDMTLNEDGEHLCRLNIPNREIRTIYRKEIISLLIAEVGDMTVTDLRDALLNKDSAVIKETLGRFMMQTISYYDGLRESYYHGLMLGLITIFEYTHFIRSNRESGAGRYDIELIPKNAGMPGIIIEIKAGEAKDDDCALSKLAQVAFDQIEEKEYDTELRSLGVSVIHKYGIAFANKRVELKTN